MDSNANIIEPDQPSILKTFGFWAVLAGALGMVLVLTSIIGPTLEPKPSAGAQIGELAGEIKRNAWRTFFGLPKPTPEPMPFPIWNFVGLAGQALGAIAIVLAVLSGVMNEHRAYVVYGTTLGAGAILFLFFWWVAVLIAGVILLITVLQNMGDIFSL